jgi:hypothetical protein
MAFKLNPTASHRLQLLAMVNHFNQSTIGTPLTLSNTVLGAYESADEGKTKVRLFNEAFQADDFVDVTYTRLDLSEYVDMSEANGDFGWYTPDEWDAETSPTVAKNAFLAAAQRAGIDLIEGADSVSASRHFDETLNRFILTLTIDSYVWSDSVSFAMPRHFSEDITVFDLNGINYTPISAASVAANM